MMVSEYLMIPLIKTDDRIGAENLGILASHRRAPTAHPYKRIIV